MAKHKDIRLMVVTPERQVLDESVDSVVIPAHDGELGILRNRAALMCELGVGQLRYTAGSRTERLFIDGGFAQVHANEVTVLTERSCTPAEITEAMIAEADSAPPDPDGRARRRAGVLRSLKPDPYR